MTTAYDFHRHSTSAATNARSPSSATTLLIVNVTSKCGSRRSIPDSRPLYRQYHGQGFSVLGFPCDRFGRTRSPAARSRSRNFCSLTYDVSFPLFAKIVHQRRRCASAVPVVEEGKERLLGHRRDQWNFLEFLRS